MTEEKLIQEMSIPGGLTIKSISGPNVVKDVDRRQRQAIRRKWQQRLGIGITNSLFPELKDGSQKEGKYLEQIGEYKFTNGEIEDPPALTCDKELQFKNIFSKKSFVKAKDRPKSKRVSLMAFLKGTTTPLDYMPGCSNYDLHYGGCLYYDKCLVQENKRCQYFEDVILPSASDLGITEKMYKLYCNAIDKKFRLCPRCRRNELLQHQRLCDECKSEQKIQARICPKCKINPLLPRRKLCNECR